MTNEQKVLMNRIQVCDFVLLETGHFLDSHPDNADAISYFKKYNEMSRQATTEYVSKYGPLSRGDFMGGDRWTWIDGPWPWETEEE